MKYIDEFRTGTLAQKIATKIASEANTQRDYHFMEFCGGHTHAISRFGISDLLPDNVHLIHGPGCPVCVLPIGRVENAIRLAQTPGIILCSYGDMLRIPTATGMSLLKAKAQGADIRMVYSSADAIKIAQNNPQHQVVFFAIGFETTTPPTAVAIKQAQALGLNNFTIFCNHVLTPSAISHILQSAEVRQFGLVPLDGFIGPAHVSVVIGSQPYEYFAEEFQKPVVIAGFEPLDVMQAILMLIRQINTGRAEVENEFTRAVLPKGNLKAQRLVAEIFELRRIFEWRGLGLVPYSALKIKSCYAGFDAEQRFQIPALSIADNKACECGAILRGVKRPQDCKIFGTVCTPENPIGSCMVSSEGACAAHYSYGRFRDTNHATSKEN
ncbi:MAG: hydrogenase formation protein HypD [Nitrosomonas sp.]|uniref:hydrogenase formation protein HypD n=1 Tax=Nitrosomonas sp. TaxID=42353 RepID=UPI0027351114|nr:hydrogenase formation protein HypD [Nitrosomonas sp.]MDP1933368.1 hydrogenase formation protein HypD [Nitrosomonas sp.]MDP3279672.1 hydrogenase formation protein HypD [Nitrosomonas sp.]MDP3663076.1 hydrogenase formation protein HypD [Nitrosomonas sp.]MDZ4106280.1 hydrogenase formation protein HypD [Nitrosomonas sp.]